MFALVDCNNFYASCQRVFEPHLIGKPVVILSNNDGCVIARSNEAKALGIPMGAPAFEYKKLFEEHHVFVYSSNYALYGDMSSRVMNTLSTFSPEIEVYSIDEAFLKLEGFEYFDLDEYGLKIQKTVTKNTGIPISIGFAPTKALAKVANKIAKKFPERTKNVYVIDTDEKRIKALKWTKIEDVWGIGRKYAKRLQAKNIRNAYQFTELTDDWVRKEMAVVGLRLKHELEGKPTLDLESPKSKKMISTTRSFEKSLTKFEDISERVSTFTASCSEKLRRQNSHCNMIMVFVLTNYHRQDQPQYSRNIVINTDFPTNSTIELNKYAQIGLKAIFKEGYYYKKAGVIVMGLTPNDQTQLSLFNTSNPKHQPLMSVVDRLNKSYGKNKIKFGNQSLGRQWKMKQEKLSNSFTTRIDEIITIKI
ncbi:SOS mutagenesis and repair protein UmuC [Flavobacterium branchiophilum NBRC 15030 = ATCC 35035]|uniref:DNA polymerase V n=1 Tax=Flavobacterium branchiophilum TaxID=55197 RepID=A0A543G1L1_9FLAO|nr:Y-family DNA polymerase [Flavobacterium branchiophilum]OXA75273.1 SOS mutagenesis and repair protein UmuC [Flavobacterium branchiophilum NBRC 15030 = ATCC 35035]TQM39976.1 DNA polymerase V [Flavobacterium branchiophilum]GEM54589.1 SOS mutagenesis and repair protein UmuC [Flavobacterium branchiophilum NBRC 15030 = ATCC 35035]